MVIEVTLTVRSTSNGEEICDTLTINVDKQSRRPSRRKRQSVKVTTLIFNLIKVEDM
jgi:hypothetical protein